MNPVVLGMDPHKRSATIEAMAADETILGGGRYGTDREGYAAMLRYARQWPNRVWAIEGCNGIGRHIATRLLADGEQVLDVPPKLSARARVFATGQGRKTDATDAHSVALVGTRMAGLRPVVNDEQLALLRILIDRRRSLGDDSEQPSAISQATWVWRRSWMRGHLLRPRLRAALRAGTQRNSWKLECRQAGVRGPRKTKSVGSRLMRCGRSASVTSLLRPMVRRPALLLGGPR